MNKNKLYCATAIALLTLIAGLYLSGYLTLRLLKLDTGLLKWNTYLGYFRAFDLPELRRGQSGPVFFRLRGAVDRHPSQPVLADSGR